MDTIIIKIINNDPGLSFGGFISADYLLYCVQNITKYSEQNTFSYGHCCFSFFAFPFCSCTLYTVVLEEDRRTVKRHIGLNPSFSGNFIHVPEGRFSPKGFIQSY